MDPFLIYLHFINKSALHGLQNAVSWCLFLIQFNILRAFLFLRYCLTVSPRRTGPLICMLRDTILHFFAVIFPRVADIILQHNVVIGPLVADIILQQNAANGPASCGYYSAIECSNWSASCGYYSTTECSQWARQLRILFCNRMQ